MKSTHKPILVLILVLAQALLCSPLPVAAEAAMDNARLGKLIERVDENAIGDGGRWRLIVGGRAVMVITDESADRMRIMTHVTAAEAVEEPVLTRLLQANFDTALDARYAIAQNTLWSVFLHPLASLTEHDFVAGLGQVVNLAETFGESYSSGLLIFRGGDSGDLRERELIDELLRKGLSI